jgi:ABC-2 type transport system permease protein
MSETGAVLMIAQRDVLRFARDPARIVATMVFPIISIGALGTALQASFGSATGLNLLVFLFTGVFAQTLFQSTAFGVISLVDDRTSTFAQEMFVSPISRYTVILGKILGETGVAMIQGVIIVVFGFVIGVQMSPASVAALGVAGLAACFLGGAFGVLIVANLRSRNAIEQVFNFVMLPQYFFAGVFVPLEGVPWYIQALSLLSPLRYPVDFTRGLFYQGSPDYELAVLAPPIVNLTVILLLFASFLVVGTTMFVRNERNR